jgi:hypothetical protein
MAKGLVDWMPGFGGDDTTVKSQSVQQATPRSTIQRGGAAKSIASYQNSSTNYGGVNMYVQEIRNKQDVIDELEMQAG